jgi:hypothetical protein
MILLLLFGGVLAYCFFLILFAGAALIGACRK